MYSIYSLISFPGMCSCPFCVSGIVCCCFSCMGDTDWVNGASLSLWCLWGNEMWLIWRKHTSLARVVEWPRTERSKRDKWETGGGAVFRGRLEVGETPVSPEVACWKAPSPRDCAVLWVKLQFTPQNAIWTKWRSLSLFGKMCKNNQEYSKK